MVADGDTNAAIGDALGLSESTVKTHVQRMYQMWGVSSRGALVKAMQEAGVLSCPACHRATASRAAKNAAMGALLTTVAAALRVVAKGLDTYASHTTKGGGRG
jgi:hypothetical protein